MTDEELANQGRILLGLYKFLAEDRNTASYDVEDHNLCTAVIETQSGISNTFISYSNPSRLSKELRESYEIVQDVPEDQKLINIGGMAGLHTEIRLLNYIYAHNKMPSGFYTIHLFSTRTVCGTCKNCIDQVRTYFAPKNIGVKYYSLQSEKTIVLENLYDDEECRIIDIINN